MDNPIEQIERRKMQDYISARPLFKEQIAAALAKSCTIIWNHGWFARYLPIFRLCSITTHTSLPFPPVLRLARNNRSGSLFLISATSSPFLSEV
jgi:hypothetical protein